MSERDEGAEGAMVMCHVCRKEIPRSSARTAEGRDYSYFFCGGGCYQRWSANQHVDREAEERR